MQQSDLDRDSHRRDRVIGFEFECNLESVTFAERSGLTSIGGYAFYNCSSLTSIEIPAGVTSIGDYAFSRCSNLENVTFAEGSLLTSIGDYAFWYCSNLDTVYYAGSIENWFNIDFYDFFSNPLRNGADLYIGGELVTAVVVPESITTIGYQLTGCTSLTSITIHSGVTSIGSEAFRYCSNLESVTFAEGSQLTSIGDYAFYFCSNLTSIEILSGVTSIGSDAFDGCYLTIVYNYSDLEITAGSSDHGGVAQYAEVVLTEDNLGNVKDENGYVTYTDGEEVLLLGYLGSEKDIVIPEGVTRIAEYTFDENDIVSVTLPESLTAIGNSAFSGCHNLKEVYNNSSLNITAGSSGYGYVAYYAVKVHNSSESESIFDDESGFAIVDGVLYGYRGSATNIIIPETVTSIANYAFYGNTDIISVTIPTGVTSIGDYAFRDCSSLKSIEIHAGVTSIGSWAFQYCSNLNTVYYAGSIEDWLNIEFGGYNSNPLNYGADLYIGGELVTEVVVPESITTIDTQLIGCTSLTSITIHSGVTSIGRSAFSGCSNLVSVIFAEGSQLTSIGDGAFYGCSSLTSIEIPTGVTELSVSNSNTFAEGSQLTSIGGMVFYGCSSLQSIEIPAGVTSIGRSAFYNCSNLESVTFAEGSQLTSIGSSAFQDCISLKSIEIPAGVTSIGDWAFYVCSSLTSIEIPVGVTSIGGYAFYDCSNLNTVYYSGSIEDWLNIEFGSSSSNPLYYGADLYIGGELVTEVVVPESITTIATQLRGCTSLTSITIHSGVTSIGDWAFSGCSNLTSIEIPAGVTSIGDYAFYYCSGLTSINIPAGVTSIGDYAFYHCSNLETIYYNGTEEQWNAIGKGSYWDSNCGNYEVVFSFNPQKLKDSTRNR